MQPDWRLGSRNICLIKPSPGITNLKQKSWEFKRSINAHLQQVWPLNPPATRGSETAAPVLSCSSTRALPALQMRPDKCIYSILLFEPVTSRCQTASRPSGTATLCSLHTCPPTRRRRTRRRTGTEAVIPPLYFCSHQSERDFFQLLLWSLFHTTFLASFCPQSFPTSDFLFFSFFSPSDTRAHE